ncbi:MAG TPA: hypothetical protein VIV11_06925 [Kofleriaceae bacterium]
MDDNTTSEVTPASEPIDATNLIIEEIVIDDEDYDEIIVLDLRAPGRYDLWV